MEEKPKSVKEKLDAVMESWRLLNEKLDLVTAEGVAENGEVKAVVRKDRKIQSIYITPELLKLENAQLIEKLVILAIKNAIANLPKAIEAEKDRLSDEVEERLSKIDHAVYMNVLDSERNNNTEEG